jgi:PIN like domain
VTFYLDASLQIAVRTALASVREDIVYAGAPNAPKESTQDRHWLATAGRKDWVVIKRDKRIRTRPWEREALIAAGVRTFCLTGAGNYNRWDTLRLLTARWARIKQVAETIPGPYIYSVTWEGVRELSLARGKTTTKSR